MGLFDKLFSRKQEKDDTLEKLMQDSSNKERLVTDIINLVDSIKRINSFDSSVWNLQNKYDLNRRSVTELETIKNNLSHKLEQLTMDSKRVSKTREDVERAKWTGKSNSGLTNRDIDRLQRGDDR